MFIEAFADLALNVASGGEMWEEGSVTTSWGFRYPHVKNHWRGKVAITWWADCSDRMLLIFVLPVSKCDTG